MDRADRARMQARIVTVVYRAEMRRLALLDVSPADRRESETAIQRRSIELIDEAFAKLEEGSAVHADARRRLADARAEIPDPDAA